MVKDMYEETCTSFKSMCLETEGFRVKVGMYQASALSPYLFFVVMDEVTKEI